MLKKVNSYNSLAEALKAIGSYDHNDLTDDQDTTPQNFIVVYTKNQDKDKENPSVPPAQGTDGHEFGSFGEKIEQYGLLSALLLTIPILIFLGLNKLKKKSE